MSDEFELIAKYFAPLAGAGGLGLLDDAAIMTPAIGKDLVISKDMLVAGVHFFEDDDPAQIAMKALGVNLSDLAGKGASPIGYLLAIALTQEISDDWLESFSSGLKASQEKYGFCLLGGDTVKTPGPLTISITIFGDVAGGQVVKRSGAKVGDIVYVTGTIGDGALGLIERSKFEAAAVDRYLLNRYLEPQPRVALGRSLAGLVGAGMDISDGLLADASHMMKASGCGMYIERDKIPISEQARLCIEMDASLWQTVLAGGDDYELLLTCRPDRQHALMSVAKQADTLITAIGVIIEGDSLDVRDGNGETLDYDKLGYVHF
jgi:thiamine-monophosphate kinase